MSKDIGKLAGGWIRRLGTLAAGLGLIAGVAPVRGESLRALGWDRAAGEVHLFRLSGDQPATPIRTAALADSIRVVTAPGGPVLLPASRPPTGAAKGTLIFDYNPAVAQSLPLDVAGVKSADGIPLDTAVKVIGVVLAKKRVARILVGDKRHTLTAGEAVDQGSLLQSVRKDGVIITVGSARVFLPMGVTVTIIQEKTGQ